MPITGTPPNQTQTRTDGTRVGTTVWQQSSAASRGIQALDNDTHDNDIVAGINNCVFRNGGNLPSANLPMNGYQHTGAAAATATGQYTEYSQMNSAIAALIPSGTVLAFFQASAPVGWTQITTYNNLLPRIVSGTGGGYFTSGQTFTSATAQGTVDGHAISVSEMPSHNHTITDPGHTHPLPLSLNGPAAGSGGSDPGSGVSSGSAVTGITINNTGGGAAHTHTFTSNALNINYVDMILCSKN